MRAWLYNIYKGVLTTLGDIMVATQPPKTMAKQIMDMDRVIECGDIICRGYTYYLDSIFIPGDYTHSGIVYHRHEMFHMIAEGIKRIHPIDFIKDTDRFIVLRPFYPKGTVMNCIRRAMQLQKEKKEYDFLFNEDNKYYCHEFTAECLSPTGISISRTIKRFGIWPFRFQRELYLAKNLIDKFEIVYEFNP